MTPNLRLEAYGVFTEPADDATRIQLISPLPKNLERMTIHPAENPRLTRAIALQSDTDFDEILGVLRWALESGLLRWLEIGLHGYGLIDGKAEYRPWRRNRYLGLAQFVALGQLEPEVRYHAPDGPEKPNG
jgi:hypothetical protein